MARHDRHLFNPFRPTLLRAHMRSMKAVLAVLTAVAMTASACTFDALPSPQAATPTLAGSETPAPTETAVAQLPSPTASMTSAAPTLPPVLESPTHTFTPAPPTPTFTPSATLGPYEYTIQTGDTLLYIVQLAPFNYTQPSIINEVLALNPNMTSVDRLPPAGSILLIPRQTATPTPPGFELTLAVDPSLAEPPVTRPEDGLTTQVAVREGETILGVAAQNETTLVILATLNPDLSFFNCDFNNPSGGPDCNVPLSVDALINVPAQPPTPTLTPTFSGSETATAIPTFAPPRLVFPPERASASARAFQVQWVSVGVLAPEHVYFVQVEDLTSGAAYSGVTRGTSYNLPESLVPIDGQPHTIRWRVSVAEPNSQGAYRIISGETPWREFTWQSR